MIISRQSFRSVSLGQAQTDVSALTGKIKGFYLDLNKTPTQDEIAYWLNIYNTQGITALNTLLNAFRSSGGSMQAVAQEQAQITSQAQALQQQKFNDAKTQVASLYAKYGVTASEGDLNIWASRIAFEGASIGSLEADLKRVSERIKWNDFVNKIFRDFFEATPTDDDWRYWLGIIQKDGFETTYTKVITLTNEINGNFNNILKRSPTKREKARWFADLYSGTLTTNDFSIWLDKRRSVGVNFNLVKAEFDKLNWPVDEDTVIMMWAEKLATGEITLDDFKNRIYMDFSYTQIKGVYQDLFGKFPTENEKGGLFILMRDKGLKDVKKFVLDLRELINGVYQALLNRDADESGMNYWFENLLLANKSIEDFKNTIIASEEYKRLHPVGTPVPDIPVILPPTAPAGATIGWLAIAGTVALLLL